MDNRDLERTFQILNDLSKLGPEYFDLKIRLVHQELQDAKRERELDTQNKKA